jgi:hypothetical protein
MIRVLRADPRRDRHRFATDQHGGTRIAPWKESLFNPRIPRGFAAKALVDFATDQYGRTRIAPFQNRFSIRVFRVDPRQKNRIDPGLT